jgi:outer membrane protein OmpA-like peptidoglycan-associated protein
MSPMKISSLAAALLLGVAGAAAAQQSPAQPGSDPQPAAQQPAGQQSPVPVNAPAPGGASEGAEAAGKLVLLFDTGSAQLDARNEAILDKASRLYREGKPIIMIVSGSSDTVGPSSQNLLLSQARANAVARGLLARGIPAERTQILAKGETNLPVQTAKGVPEAQNRRAEITWR